MKVRILRIKSELFFIFLCVALILLRKFLIYYSLNLNKILGIINVFIWVIAKTHLCPPPPPLSSVYSIFSMVTSKKKEKHI